MQRNYTTNIIIIFGGLLQLLVRELIMMMNKGIFYCKNKNAIEETNMEAILPVKNTTY